MERSERGRVWRRAGVIDINVLEGGFKYYFQLFLRIYILHMSKAEQSQQEDKTNPKRTHQVMPATNRWTNISSDQDESESEQSEKQQPQIPVATVPETKQTSEQPPQEETKKKEPNVVPFDPKKKFRGDRSNVKVIKGGFKAEKLQQKKFQLNTIRNPFAVDEESEDQNQDTTEPTTQNAPAQEQPSQAAQQPEEPQGKSKKTKKSKKQQEKEQLEELMKELGVENKTEGAQDGEGKKKKKKNKAKKVEAEGEEVKQQAPAPEAEAQPEKVEQFTVDRQQIEEVMRKKAAESAKAAPKKGGKGAVALNAKKAIGEREAKNKSKKVYVDL